jgi:hypothetical protein
MPLLIGLLVLLMPLGVGAALNWFGYWRYGVWGESWPSLFARMGVISLGLSLVTFGMVPGNAIAGERADRSVEFLGYLPPSRAAHLLSKGLVAVFALAVAWAANATCAWVIAPALGEVPADSADFVRTTFPWLSAAAVAVFGAAWLGSSVSPSPVYATGIGFAAPWLVLSSLAVGEFGFGYEGWIGAGFVPVNIVVGSLCFVAGIVCYLRRIQP